MLIYFVDYESIYKKKTISALIMYQIMVFQTEVITGVSLNYE